MGEEEAFLTRWRVSTRAIHPRKAVHRDATLTVSHSASCSHEWGRWAWLLWHTARKSAPEPAAQLQCVSFKQLWGKMAPSAPCEVINKTELEENGWKAIFGRWISKRVGHHLCTFFGGPEMAVFHPAWPMVGGGMGGKRGRKLPSITTFITNSITISILSITTITTTTNLPWPPYHHQHQQQ